MIDEYITLEGLKRDFDSRNKLSKDKDALLKREIEGIELIFDDKRLITQNYFQQPLLYKYSINYVGEVIDIIRATYNYFIIDGNDLSKAQDWAEKYSEPYFELESLDAQSYLQLTNDLFEYLKWLRDYPLQHSSLIVEEEYIGLIYNEFKYYFPNESKESWKNRFYFPNSQPVKPIEISNEAREGSSKLVLIAILDNIQDKKKRKFNFDEFVLERFGIDNFSRAKNQHRHKDSFKGTSKKCDSIFNK